MYMYIVCLIWGNSLTDCLLSGKVAVLSLVNTCHVNTCKSMQCDKTLQLTTEGCGFVLNFVNIIYAMRSSLTYM